jgi:predicted RNA-binding protein YlxR (DUF448 family)
MKPKRDLIRAVRSPEGVVSLDFKGKSPGRGAYVCKSADCLKKAIRSKALERALESALPEEVAAALNSALESALHDTTESVSSGQMEESHGQ